MVTAQVEVSVQVQFETTGASEEHHQKWCGKSMVAIMSLFWPWASSSVKAAPILNSELNSQSEFGYYCSSNIW